MPRYIIIDNRSGYVILDTADIDGVAFDVGDPVIACRLYNSGQSYRVTSNLGCQAAGYRVYHANDEIPIIQEFRHPHLIELIEFQCLLVANIRIVS